MYKVNVEWNGKMRFDGTDAEGRCVVMDAAEVYGGEGKGARPTELLLISLAGCSGIEVGNVMNRMRLLYDTFKIAVEAEKAETVPHVFTEIRVHYTVNGQGITAEKFIKAFEIGALKYCSVANMVKKSCPVTYSYSINGENFVYHNDESI
ncbi:MAG: OsmC family protein [Desulfobulbaceae bacterium]|nr:OsmC family protein [Desulfobulbaceae bacterium]